MCKFVCVSVCTAVHNLVPYLDAVKAIKSQTEVELLREACRIAGHAFKAV